MNRFALYMALGLPTACMLCMFLLDLVDMQSCIFNGFGWYFDVGLAFKLCESKGKGWRGDETFLACYFCLILQMQINNYQSHYVSSCSENADMGYWP